MKVFCAGLTGRLAFEHPRRCIEAWHAGDVPEAFARIEAALASVMHVAGFVSYELGASIVPRQPPVETGNVPLISLGVFEAPQAETAFPPTLEPVRVGPLAPLVSQEQYRASVAAIVAAIGEGDVYQVNYAVPFAFAFAGDPYALYATLARERAYPYAAFVERDTYAFVSCSPELFVRIAEGRIVTKPMKGTATHADARDLENAKNRAEHVMIVDLLRNDLQRLGGTAVVERLLEVESYPAFETMTSTIRADIDPVPSFESLVRSMFPCGSVTGAPKIAAMNAIARAEPVPRGIFCGSIGYLAPDRSGVWNVAIRTASLDRTTGRGLLHVGGGIVADSTAGAEWAEILTKRTFFASIAPAYALIETMLCEGDGTIAYLEPHLTRLRRACDDLHFPYDDRAIRDALRERAADERGILRMQLESDGRFEITAREARLLAEPVVCGFAAERVASNEPLQGYKTTWRPHYDAALASAERRGWFDAILCNERDELADGARSNVFVRSGASLLTPPLSSGALPGILRARLIASGAAHEAVLARADITDATDVYIGNSVRGLLRARIVTER